MEYTGLQNVLNAVRGDIVKGKAAVEAEAEARDEAIAAAIAAEAEAREEAIAGAKLSIQTWLAAVQTKAGLPEPAALDADVNYLCRVINDTGTPGNNGVWQLVAGESAWSYFSDNLDFIDEDELAEALGTEADARDTAISTAISQEVTNRNSAITTAVSEEATARGTAINGAIATEVTNRNTAIGTAISGISAEIEALTEEVEQIDTEVSYETVYA